MPVFNELKVPAAQAVHTSEEYEPEKVLYFPAVQAVHEVDHGILLYVPA